MTFQLLPTLPDALRILSENTGTTWTRIKFFQAVIDHALPLRATVPANCYVVDNMGKGDFDAGFQKLEFRRLALLDSYEIKDLAANGNADTRNVALDPGDPEFRTWPEIKIYRQQQRHSGHDVFMGETVFKFSEWIKVTDETCRVPTETLDELQALFPNQTRSAGKATPTSSAHLMKRNSLDGPIEEAVKRAGSTSSGIVWIHLRELALEGVAPFTGEVEGDVLHYTDDNNKPAKLAKDALKKRLQKYRRAATP